MENAPPIIVSEMRGKFLSAQVGEDVPIPRIVRGDEEEMFIGKIIMDWGFNVAGGKV